jgi:hypothetical protein
MARGVGGSENRDAGSRERGGKVEGSAIDTDHGMGAASGVDEAGKSREMQVNATDFF